jgi:hypothetical protein
LFSNFYEPQVGSSGQVSIRGCQGECITYYVRWRSLEQ